jgi:hypothetical protein
MALSSLLAGEATTTGPAHPALVFPVKAKRVVQLQFYFRFALGVKLEPEGAGRLFPHLRIRGRNLLARGQRENGVRRPTKFRGGGHFLTVTRFFSHAARSEPMEHTGHS